MKEFEVLEMGEKRVSVRIGSSNDDECFRGETLSQFGEADKKE